MNQQAGLSTGQPSTGAVVIPDPQSVDARMKTSKGALDGLKYGVLYGAIASVPLFGVEKLFKTGSFTEASIKALQLPPEMQERLLAKFKRPAAEFALSAGSTILVGATAGTILGAWFVGHAKKKLRAINDAKLSQQQGTFVYKTPTKLQQWGLKDMPVNDPNQAYQQMLQNDLNPDQAFKHGVKVVLFQKVILAVLSFLATYLALGILKRKGIKSVPVMGIDFKLWLEQSVHPAIIAKTLALPIVGGYVAKKLVPWMREQMAS